MADDYGLVVYGDSGSVQVDSTYSNLALVAKGTATTTTSANNGYYVDISYTGTNPVIAIQNSDGYYTVLGLVTVSGSTWTWRFLSPITQQSSFTYFIFDQPSASSTTGYGLVVKNASGVVTFNSNNSYMRVLGFSQTTSDATQSETTVATYAGKTVAFVPGGISFYQLYTPGTTSTGTLRYLFGTYRVSGSTVYVKGGINTQFTTSSAGASYSAIRQNISGLFIDVTNM